MTFGAIITTSTTTLTGVKMANKYDILSWKDGVRQHTKRRADCYKRLALWQSRGDDVKCDETYAQIARHNQIIEALQYELGRAGVLETAE